jgi:hypothetical protein
MPQDQRAGLGTIRSIPPEIARSEATGHGVAWLAVSGEALVLRMDGPLSSMRCALWSRRSQMASARVGSPIPACQSRAGTWVARCVEAR